MTIVTSNSIGFTIGLSFANSSTPPSAQLRRVFTGTQYYYGGKPDEPPFAILAYSGCAYDPASGRIYLFGGGHHDYAGNEVWEFCVDRPQDRWTRHYAPSSYTDRAAVVADVDNAGRPGMYVSTRRPIARHTYHSLTWATAVGKIFVGGGSTWDGVDGTYWSIYPNAPGDFWSYEPSGKTWGYCGSSLIDTQMPVLGAIVYHPQRGTLLAISGRKTATYDPRSVSYTYADGSPTVWEYSPTASTWADHGVALAGPLENSLVALDSARNRLVVMSWDRSRSMSLFTYDVAARAWTQRSTSGVTPPPPFGSVYAREGDRIVFSTLSGRLLYVSATNDGALYALDMDTWTWSQLLAAGAFPQIGQAFAAVWCPRRNEMYVTYKLESSQSTNVVGVSA